MKIHVFIAHMGIGGAERVCVNLANEWADKGHEVHIVVLNLKNDIYTKDLRSGVTVHELGVSRLRYSFLPMLRFVRKNKPSFMLIFGNEMAVIMNKLKSLHLVDTPLIVRVLNNVNISLAKEDGISPIVEEYLKKAQSNLKSVEHIVAQCEGMGKQLTEKGLVVPERLSVIYNPVSRELCDKVIVLRKTRPDSGIKEIVFIGRIDPQKKPLDLLEAFAKIYKNNKEIRLRLVGDGVLTDTVRAKADELGIADSVIIDGIRNDMENVYFGADVVALSSEYEGMPNCLIEAIGCGIPIVSYDCPIGPSEIVVDNVNGYLIQKGDVDALAEGLQKTLDKPWDRDSIIATCDKFDVKNISDEYLNVFKSINADK